MWRHKAPATPVGGSCAKHPFEQATDRCASCSDTYCDDCLLRPAGHKRALCVRCAVIAAGLRRHPRMAHL